MNAMQNAIDRFSSAMHAAGIVPPDGIKCDGRIHRFHVEGDKAGSLNGWYLLHLDGRPAGAFGSWKLGIQSTWTAGGLPLSASERASISNRLAIARVQAEFERRVQHEAAAALAQAEWSKAEQANPTHAYLLKKEVQPYNLRQHQNTLLVPLLDPLGLLWNVQRILPDGAKLFSKGARAGGLFSPIGDLTTPRTILICEGWATGATLHEESGYPVLCAMNAGNLLPVAKAARKAWPAAELLVCADNDRNTPGNPGLTKATEAAKAVGAKLTVPQFPDCAPGSDFNDLALLRRKGGRHA
ncbi:toprim domain-containing protein [Niveibacterium sp.]|uniref:toprim domain-containing protein n=1 Tax=Niveibacterium sp. TaxID=2017444 RepID=UPI0035ADE254